MTDAWGAVETWSPAPPSFSAPIHHGNPATSQHVPRDDSAFKSRINGDDNYPHNDSDGFKSNKFEGAGKANYEAFHGDEPAESGGRGGCFNCGEDGHNKNDCPNPRVFSGTCNVCGEEGHMRKECPNKPPQICNNCGQEGHTRVDCENARKIDRGTVPDTSPEVALEELKVAIRERDVDDAKEALQKFLKNFPSMTFVDLHKALRQENAGLWLIPLERPLVSTLTNMDLQGNLNKKFSVSYRFSDKPERPREAAGWPENEAEIIERLADAGEVVDRGLPKCSNCDELGHISKSCTKEKQERTDRPKVECYNCGEVGHRVRDCSQPRVDKFTCKNCGQSGHKVAECTEPRSAENVECRKCNETGHFSRDCPQGGGGDRACRNCGEEGHIAKECTAPRNMDNVQCRNCDEMGHMSRDCKKPRDMSKLVCNNCGEKGHSKVKCNKPAPEDEFGGGDYSNGDQGNQYMSDSGGADQAPAAQDDCGW